MTWRSRKKLKNSIGFKLILARKSQKPIKPWGKRAFVQKTRGTSQRTHYIRYTFGSSTQKFKTTERVHLRKTDSISNSGS